MANHYSGKRAAGRKPVGKRALSLLMALVMSLSLVQITAFAVDGSLTDEQAAKKAAQIVDAGGETTGIDTTRVTMSKTAEVTDTEGKFLVTLNVTTKDKIETVTEEENPSIDVVLVIDRSGSMDDYGRLKSAKQAATAFVNSFLGDETKGERQVAVVSFGEYAKIESELTDDLVALRGEKQQGGGHGPGHGPGSRDEYKGGAINSDSFKADGGTNIQAGLKEAREVLADSEALYKYVILLSDGAPTYYYKPGAENTTATDIIPVSYGPFGIYEYNQTELGTGYNYSDRKGTGRNTTEAHIYNTVSEAYLLKDMKVEIYGIGISLDSAEARYTMYNSVTKVTGADGKPSAETHYYDCNSKTGDELADELDKVFSVIEKNITVKTQAWEVSDVMGNAVDFAGFVGEANNAVYAYNEATNAITWLLRNITDPTVDEDGRYVYTLQYYVTLKDAYRDNSEAGYPTNASATLKYYFDDVKDTDGSLKLLSADFQQPKVKGYKADLSLTKVDNENKPLEGATFSLFGTVATSDEDGKVEFKDIPSGYIYSLKEIDAPKGYVKSDKEWMVTVSYGDVTVTEAGTQNVVDLADFKVVNTPEQPEPPVEKTYTVTVNYLEQGTNKVLADPYTESHTVGESYNVTAKDAIAIDGYTYVTTAGELTGTPEVDVVINVYYTQKDDGPKTEWDIGVAKTATNLDDNYLSNVTLTIETVQKAEPVDPPSGGDDDEEEVVQPGDQDEREETDPDEDEEEAGSGDTDKGGDSETEPVIGGDDNANAAASVMSTLDDPEEFDPIENGDDDEEESQPGQGEKVTVLEAGAYVVDAIGYGTDDKGNAYDFAFVTDAKTLSMELNGTTYPATQVETKAGATASYVFLASVDGEFYPVATVDYYVAGVADGVEYDEYFVWTFAEAIMSGDVLKLHYQVKLTDPQTAAGTYGKYDADGSEGYTSLYTNKYANLLDNADHMVAVFPKPTVSYTVKSEPVDPPVGPSYDYYTVTVNYYDKDSGEVIHTAYTTTQREYTAYDVTAQDKIAITGYTYVETIGDALTGTLNGNKVINVYYTKDNDIDDGNTPTDPGTDIGDDDVPVTPAKPPKTGDSMGLWIAAAMVSGMGLIWLSLSGKKRKEEI